MRKNSGVCLVFAPTPIHLRMIECIVLDFALKLTHNVRYRFEFCPPARFHLYNEKLSNKLVGSTSVDNKLPIESMKNRSHSTAVAQCSILEDKTGAKCRKICKAIVSSSMISVLDFLQGNEQRYKKIPNTENFFSRKFFPRSRSHTMKNNFCMSLRSDGEFSQAYVRERKTETEGERGRERENAPQWLNSWHWISFALRLLFLSLSRFRH